MGGRKVRSWQFGLRPPRLRMLWVVLLPLGLFLVFLIFSVIWAGILDESTKEKILEQLGADPADVRELMLDVLKSKDASRAREEIRQLSLAHPVPESFA